MIHAKTPTTNRKTISPKTIVISGIVRFFSFEIMIFSSLRISCKNCALPFRKRERGFASDRRAARWVPMYSARYPLSCL